MSNILQWESSPRKPSSLASAVASSYGPVLRRRRSDAAPILGHKAQTFAISDAEL